MFLKLIFLDTDAYNNPCLKGVHPFLVVHWSNNYFACLQIVPNSKKHFEKKYIDISNNNSIFKKAKIKNKIYKFNTKDVLEKYNIELSEVAWDKIEEIVSYSLITEKTLESLDRPEQSVIF